MKKIIAANFQVNSPPIASNKLVLLGLESNPTAPSKVPIGQIYLQNAGTAMPLLARPNIKGIPITIINNMKYFK